MLESIALIVLIYAVLFGPIIGGAIAFFKAPGLKAKLFGVGLIVITVVLCVIAFLTTPK